MDAYHEIRVYRHIGLADCYGNRLTREQLDALVKLAESQIRAQVALQEIEAKLAATPTVEAAQCRES